MATFIVAYDLHEPGQSYDCIIAKLTAYPTHWHMQQSVWIIVTTQTAMQILDNLKTCLDANDKLFVGELGKDAAWIGYSNDVTTWLKKHL